VLILAGQSLTQATRPNTNLSDYLDTANADGNAVFNRTTVSASSNDRVVSVGNY
jgi:hypothetical protein